MPVADWLRRTGVDPAGVCGAVGLADLSRVRLIPPPRWMRWLWVGDVAAMTLGDRIFVLPRLLGSEPSGTVGLVVHELVHVRQWRLEGSVRFLTRYLFDYLRGRMRRLGHAGAYHAIRYEAEAVAVARSFRSLPPAR